MRGFIPIAVGLALSFAAQAAAAACIAEAEPNQTPELATRAGADAGDICARGNATADDQDMIGWDVDRAGLWTIRLETLPGAVGNVQLVRTLPDASAEIAWKGDADPATGLAVSPPLLLGPGRWFLGVAAAGEPMRWRAYAEGGAPLPPAPDSAATSTATDAFRTRLDGTGETVEFAWTLTPTAAAPLWDLGLQAAIGENVSAEVYGPDGTYLLTLAGAPADGVATSADLRLAPGDYRVNLRGLSAGAPAILSAQAADGGDDEVVAEPDFDLARAHDLTTGQSLGGRLVAPGSDWDIDSFAFDVAPGGGQVVIAVDSRSPRPIDLTITDADGVALADTVTGTGSLRLGPYALPPGRYGVALRGNLGPGDRYTVTLDPAPPLPPGTEAEPNDRDGHPSPVAPGQPLRGTLTAGDRDYVALDLPADATGAIGWWTIRATGPGQIDMDLLDATGASVAGATGAPGAELPRLALAPGRHLLELQGAGPWMVDIVPATPPGPDEEREPNDAALDATELAVLTQAGGTLAMRFRLDHGGDLDRFGLDLAAPHRVALTVDAPAATAPVGEIAQATGAGGATLDFAPDPVDPARVVARWDGVVAAGRLDLTLRGYGVSAAEGRVTLALSPPFDGGAARIDGDPALTGVAANDPRVQGLRVTAALPDQRDGTLEPWVSDADWRIAPAPGSPGSFRLEAPAYLAPGAAITWAVARTRAGGAAVAVAQGRVEARDGAATVDPAPAAALPAPLLGAIDAARTAFGAVVSDPAAALFDGQIDGTAVDLTLAEPVAIDLPGAAPLPVLGLVATQSALAPPGSRLRRVRIEVADTGGFAPVWTGELAPHTNPQPVVFDTPVPSPVTGPVPGPVPARTVRLVPLDRWDGSAERATLSGLSVLTPPAALPEARDLALPDLGGHVVRASETDYALVGEGTAWPGSTVVFQTASGAPEWVMQFHDSRAAPLSRIAVTADPAAPPAQRIARLAVEASLAGPLGPWRPLGEMAFDPATGAGALALDPPVWARAIRFAADRGDGRVAMPGSVSVIEDRGAANGGTILGEWGALSPQAVREQMHPDEDPRGQAGGDTPVAAEAIASGAVATGWVSQTRPSAWFLIDPPPDARRLVLAATGDGARVALTDRTGASVPLTPDPGGQAAPIAPGQGPFRLEISRPADAIVVAWDTSLSVSTYTPAILSAVRDMAENLSPGVQAMNFVPFRASNAGDDGRPLMDRFATTPAEAWGALQAYPNRDSDSDAEAALIVASRALAAEDGRHAIVLITDASSPSARSAALWAALDAARPRVFALRIPTGTRDRAALAQAQQMQDWAALNGGFHRILASTDDAATAFRDLTAILRRPVPFRVSWRSETTLPGPGLLQVVAPQGTAGATGLSGDRATLVILDASGSMLQRIDGTPRIEIAKSILRDLVADRLPAGAPFALRAFGTGGRGSCASTAALPLGPLDADGARAAIDAVRAEDGAKTAIAASLREVAGDLAGAAAGTGAGAGQLVILITDGEETCGGDPEAEIAALRAAGVDVRLNIVGFDLDGSELAADFARWAAAGGGAFFDAGDAASLDAAVAAALAPGFRVIGADGAVVARGTVGAPAIPVPAGLYDIQIDGGDRAGAEPLPRIEVRPGETAVMTLPEAGRDP